MSLSLLPGSHRRFPRRALRRAICATTTSAVPIAFMRRASACISDGLVITRLSLYDDSHGARAAARFIDADKMRATPHATEHRAAARSRISPRMPKPPMLLPYYDDASGYSRRHAQPIQFRIPPRATPSAQATGFWLPADAKSRRISSRRRIAADMRCATTTVYMIFITA